MVVNCAAMAGLRRTVQFLAGDLDADNVAVMAHAELAETEGANRVFTALDHVERLARHGTAVFDARGEAGGCRLVPDAQAGLACQFADVLLGESGFQQRRGNMMLFGGLLAGAEVALIVQVHTVGDRVEPARGAKVFHDCEEFVFAVKAALAVIAGIFGTIEFRSGDDFERNSLLVGEGDGVGQVRAGQAGGIGDHRQHVVAESAMSGPGEIGGIDTAGIGDQHAA